MPRPVLAAPVLVAALLVASCSSPPAPKTDPPASASGPASTLSAASTSSTTTATASATPTPGTVPLDQIPPGRPARWIPAGMPTVAPWKEPGDVLPMFTLTMFEHTSDGAYAAARYYVTAKNWALAALDPTPFLLICEAAPCRASADMVRGYAAKGQHVQGGREVGLDRNVLPASGDSGSEWVVRIHLLIKAGALVDRSGAVAQRRSQSAIINDLYLRWTGRLWAIHQDALGPKADK